ncbi:cell fusion related protein [Tieghemostelium lacteum]|uniref:Cell fusion related protein n=1 Tax=Tieghemostelium lacteum TaxID=361077 RepID=A0A151Z6N0_TIELA|nr:cell fusion related protein [Tieghemostelium lacteum]|eukprot:KYQ89619.1 cell fusion related protein [Tieghemostelium lacteum]
MEPQQTLLQLQPKFLILKNHLWLIYIQTTDLIQTLNPNDLSSQLLLVPVAILPQSSKDLIVLKTINTINGLTTNLASLKTILSEISTTSLSLSASNTKNINQVRDILNNTKVLLEFQYKNLDQFYQSSVGLELNSQVLFLSGQSLLENFLEFSSSLWLTDIIGNEILSLNQFIMGNLSESFQEERRIYQFSSYYQFVATSISSLKSLLETKINVSIIHDFNISSEYVSPFHCHYQFYESTQQNLLTITSIQQILDNTGTILLLKDAGICRDLYTRSKSLEFEMVLPGNSPISKISNTSFNQDTQIINLSKYNYIMTSSVFLDISQDLNSLNFSSDGYVLELMFSPLAQPLSAPIESLQFPNNEPSNLAQNTSTCNPICDYPKCCLQDACIDNAPPTVYYFLGQCDRCNAINETKAVNVYPSGSNIGNDKNCPYLCKNGGEYKLGGIADYNYTLSPCVTCPHGWYSPPNNNSKYACTIPAGFNPFIHGFISNAASDNCKVSSLYQVIFVNKDTSTLRLVSPSSILDNGKTIEMYLKIINLDPLSSKIFLTGVQGSIKIGFVYSNVTQTLSPSIFGGDDKIVISTNIGISVNQFTSFFHYAIVMNQNIIEFFINGNSIGSSVFTKLLFSQTPGFQFLGGTYGQRMAFKIDEFRIFNQVLSPLQFGLSRTDYIVKHSCNMATEQMIQGKCVQRHASDMTFDPVGHSYSCYKPDMEVVGTKCLLKCPPGQLRNSDLQCSCIDGKISTWKANSVVISSIYQYDHAENYYAENNIKSIGLQSVQIYGQDGSIITPISCSSSSNDGVNTCDHLTDGNSTTHWETLGNSGYGYVILNIPTNSRISHITIEPLPNRYTIKTVSLKLLMDMDELIIVPSFLLPMSVDPKLFYFSEKSHLKESNQFIGCSICPTVPILQDNENSLTYRFPSSSVIPRQGLSHCTCLGNFKFDPKRRGCTPPLPTPEIITDTLVPVPMTNNWYNVKITDSIRVRYIFNSLPGEEIPVIRYSLDNSDPTEQSPIYPISGMSSLTMKTMYIKLKAFSLGRISSEVFQGVFQFKGIIECQETPPYLNVEYNSSVNMFIHCQSQPLSDISSSWIRFTTNGNTPTNNSESYNAKKGIYILENPSLGVNNIIIRYKASLVNYFDFEQTVSYIIRPVLPSPSIIPPTTTTPNSLYITMQPSTPLSTPDFMIYYDITNNPNPSTSLQPLTISNGIQYSEQLLVCCTIPTEPCLILIRALISYNGLISKPIDRYITIYPDFSVLVPTIQTKFTKSPFMCEITILKNSNMELLKTKYAIVYSEEKSESICQQQIENGKEYTNQLLISSNERRGYYYIQAVNEKRFLPSGITNTSSLVCKEVVFTQFSDSPLITPDATQVMFNNSIDSEYTIKVTANQNTPHAPNFYFEINSNKVPTIESTRLLPNYTIVLKLGPNEMSKTFSVSVIDCPDNFICSLPTTKSIKLVRRCPTPFISPKSGTFLDNVTITVTCEAGCNPRYDIDNVPNINSPLFPNPLLVTYNNAYDSFKFGFLSICAHPDNEVGVSVVTPSVYNIDRYYRPKPPLITLNRDNQEISMTCKTSLPDEECSIYFSIDSPSQPIEGGQIINPLPERGSREYQYKYRLPFKLGNNKFVGPLEIRSISVISTSTITYERDYSIESTMDYTVFGVPAPHATIIALPVETIFNVSVQVYLTSTALQVSDYIKYYTKNINDTYVPKIDEYKIWYEPIQLTNSSLIYAFIDGRQRLTPESIIPQVFTYYLNGTSPIIIEVPPKVRQPFNTKWLWLLLLLLVPISIAGIILGFKIFRKPTKWYEKNYKKVQSTIMKINKNKID